MEPALARPGATTRKWWLSAGFVVVILLMVLVTAVGVERMTENNRRMQAVIDHHNVKIDLTLSMYTLARERSITLLSMVTMEDPFDREEKREYYVELGGKFAAARAEFSHKKLDKEEKALLDAQGALSRLIVPVQDKVIDLLDQDDLDGAVEILLDQGIPAQDKALAQLKEILDFQYELAKRALHETSQIVKTTTIFMSLLALVTIGLSVGIAFFVIRKTRRDEHEIERLDKLKRFLSPEVAKLVTEEQEKSLLQSHRAYIAAVFCDLRGFTSFSANMEPEEVMGVLQVYHENIGQLVAEHDGTIDHRAGDGLMVFFNDPLPCEEPVFRAVRLALSMRESFIDMNSDWTKRGYQLGFGVGIASGHATLGVVGFEGRYDYTANGNAVNLAARLCDEAGDGQILISHKAYIELDERIEAQPIGERTLKGFPSQITAYNILGISS